MLALLLSVVGLRRDVPGGHEADAGDRVAPRPRRAALGGGVDRREALVMVGAGIACAMPVAWALRRMVQAQLFGVGVFDAPTIAFASSGLGVVALGAALVPRGVRRSCRRWSRFVTSRSRCGTARGAQFSRRSASGRPAANVARAVGDADQ